MPKKKKPAGLLADEEVMSMLFPKTVIKMIMEETEKPSKKATKRKSK